MKRAVRMALIEWRISRMFGMSLPDSLSNAVTALRMFLPPIRERGGER